MTVRSFFHDCDISYQIAKNADNEELTGAGVDMKGKEAVVFVAFAIKGEALSFSMHAEQDAASDFSGTADLLGTSVAFTTGVSTDGLAVLEIVKPLERYVRPIIVVPDAAAATATGCIALTRGAKDRPVTAPTAGEIHVSPAEGTV